MFFPHISSLNYFLLMECACQFGQQVSNKHNNENANRNIAGVDSGDLATETSCNAGGMVSISPVSWLVYI
jgi:hypothetical protein